MNELLIKIEKEEKVDLNKELKTIVLDDLQALLLSTYIVDKSIAQIREAYDMPQSIASISQVSEEYIKQIKNGENKKDIADERFLNLIDIALIQVIKNIKSEFSFIELVDEANLIVAQFINQFYEKLAKKYSIEKIKEIFSIFCSIKLLQFQIKKENEEYSAKISILVYLKVRDRLAKNEELKSILEGMGIKEEYYNNLDKMYHNIEIEDLDDVYSYTEKVIDEFERLRQTFMFNYFEETFLIKFLNINGRKNEDKEICESMKIGEKEFKDMLKSIMKKISETEEA
ncbi:hypothetical protein [Sneathia sanguinegens]|uniref:hypothetical protein n=1 Tax=Sneathia sanguinegens TaxID=40543 RepID=UPI00082F9965|nr:hypothetical protein [Sneathia sanguinegens]MDU4651942.1 hypothetical protein [Sneathia sanguinegens]MDU7497054.1 hypothetical protein [Sneathia sanguinegens]